MSTFKPEQLSKICGFPCLYLLAISGSAAEVFRSELDREQVKRIDLLVEQRLKALNQKPNPRASDGVLLRRLYLQIIGRNPTVHEYDDFMEAASVESSFAGLSSEQKKQKLIERLLASREYASHEFNYWSEMKNNPDNSNMNSLYFWDWFKDQLDNNLPFDKFVHKMLTETGSIYEGDGVAREFRANNNFANWFAETMLFFHGTHITCAQCHDHPTDSYTQKDYYQLTAFLRNDGHPNASAQEDHPINKVNFGKIRKVVREQKDVANRTEALVNRFDFWFSKWAKPQRLTKAGVDRLPEDYQSDEADGKPGDLVRAHVPYGTQPQFEYPAADSDEADKKKRKGHRHRIDSREWSSNDSRVAFADWFTAKDNPRFTRMLANRIWKRTMGIGLFEPIDKIKSQTRASDPALMQALIEIIHENEFRLKNIYRVIYSSQIFSRESSRKTVTFSRDMGFLGPISRRVSAEQMWDNLMVLRSDLVGQFDGEPRPDHPSRLHPYKAYFERGYLNFNQEQATDYILKAGREAKKAGMNPLDYENKKLGHGGSRGVIASESVKANKDTPNIRGIEYRYLRASELRIPAKIDHFLAHFGQSSRKELFGSVREASSTQALLMLNWAEKNLFFDKSGIMSTVSQRDGDEKIKTLFKGTLSRLPSERELKAMMTLVSKFGDAAYRDILWVLVNSVEFRTLM